MPAQTFIPLDVAQQVLTTFGINEPTSLYERWVTPNGFKLDDLHMVLTESRFIFIIDWRAALPEELAPIALAVAELGATLKVEVADDADEGWVECGGNREHVRYVPKDNKNFAGVILALQKLMPPTIEFREGTSCRGSDTWEFAVLLRAEWAALETLDRPMIQSMFEPLPSGGGHNHPQHRTGAAGIVSKVRKWFGRGPGQ